jgi:hypothetical protein
MARIESPVLLATVHFHNRKLRYDSLCRIMRKSRRLVPNVVIRQQLEQIRFTSIFKDGIPNLPRSGTSVVDEITRRHLINVLMGVTCET